MKIIPLHPLNRGRFARIDDEDYEYIRSFRWQHMQSMTYELGGYAYTNLKFRGGGAMTAGMHRVIMGDQEPYEGWAEENGVMRVTMPNGLVLFKGNKATGGLKRLTVDHIDGDGLNNCRDNLRFATAGDQMRNRCKCRGEFGSYYRECTCRSR